MEAMEHSELFTKWRPKYLELKDKPLELLKRKIQEHEGQKRLLKVTYSPDVSVLRAAFLVGNCIVKAKRL